MRARARGFCFFVNRVRARCDAFSAALNNFHFGFLGWHRRLHHPTFLRAARHFSRCIFIVFFNSGKKCNHRDSMDRDDCVGRGGGLAARRLEVVRASCRVCFFYRRERVLGARDDYPLYGLGVAHNLRGGRNPRSAFGRRAAIGPRGWCKTCATPCKLFRRSFIFCRW